MQRISPDQTAETMDGRRMRKHNCIRVLDVVRSMGPISRADVTRCTKLSPPTVSALIGDLVSAGLVHEMGEGDSRGGRRPQMVSFNSRCGVVLAANVDTTSVQLAVADMNGELIEKQTFPLGLDTRPKPLIRQASSAAKKLLKKIVGTDTPLLAAAFGMPGMTDVVNGIVIEAANLDKWVDVPARELLERELAVPVEIENDVNLAAIGERWRGGARGIKNLVFVSMGTGIGAGIVIDERLHRGHRWYAGEISHLNVDFKEWEREFGAAGYLETYLGNVPAKVARRSKQSSNSSFDENAALRLGAALANIATIIDPEAIVFGGANSLKTPDFLEKVQAVAARIAPNCPPITLSELGEDAPLFGSIRVALDKADERLKDLINERPVFAA